MSILQLGSDTLAGTAAAGQIEYNGTIQTFTPLGTQRGVVPSEQFFALNAGLAGANATGAQSIFGVGVTLSASTQYEFEAVIALSKSAGTTSHTVSLGFGGTATLNNIGYNVNLATSTASFTSLVAVNGLSIFIQTASATVVSGAITSATQFEELLIKGTVSINAGGTFIPQYTLSAAPGGAYTTAAGSYMKIKPIGVSGANVSVGTWA
jgi:hypothetical protein